MQELVSFISIMLGVIILTAWVMWILFRPSGDVKAKEFARESARDGLTRAVMENNELKNKVTRLERELKVLMSAGYGKTKEQRAGVEGERSKIKDESSRIKEETQNKEEKPVGANSIAQEKADEEKPALEQKSVDANSSAQEKAVEGKPTVEENTVGANSFAQEKVDEEKAAVEQKLVGANSFAQENDQNQAKEPELTPQPEDRRGTETTSGLDPVPEQEVQPAAEPEQELVSESAPESAPETVSETVSELEAEPELELETEVDIALEPDAHHDDETNRSHQPAFHKITDEAEKKKIAEYLANVAKTTERQKKEVEAIAKWKAAAPDADDDLKLIRGIGLHLEGKLKRAGITSYAQIANFDEDDIRRISDVIGSYPRRIKREEWVEQARKLLDKA